MAAQKKDYWVEQANVQIDAITAWVARAEGRNDEAVKLMRAAADREDKTEKHIMMPGRVIPVREMLGELLLDLDQPAAALRRSSSHSKRIRIASATSTAPHARPSSQAIVTRRGRSTRAC